MYVSMDGWMDGWMDLTRWMDSNRWIAMNGSGYEWIDSQEWINGSPERLKSEE